eukprot:gene15-biopygen1
MPSTAAPRLVRRSPLRLLTLRSTSSCRIGSDDFAECPSRAAWSVRLVRAHKWCCSVMDSLRWSHVTGVAVVRSRASRLACSDMYGNCSIVCNAACQRFAIHLGGGRAGVFSRRIEVEGKIVSLPPHGFSFATDSTCAFSQGYGSGEQRDVTCPLFVVVAVQNRVKFSVGVIEEAICATSDEVKDGRSRALRFPVMVPDAVAFWHGVFVRLHYCRTIKFALREREKEGKVLPHQRSFLRSTFFCVFIVISACNFLLAYLEVKTWRGDILGGSSCLPVPRRCGWCVGSCGWCGGSCGGWCGGRSAGIFWLQLYLGLGWCSGAVDVFLLRLCLLVHKVRRHFPGNICT